MNAYLSASLILICIGLKLDTSSFTIAGVDEIGADALQLDFGTVKAATNNFSNDNKLGQGGFGSVYKGKLGDGQDIAVKRLATGSGQGDLEFKNEVVLLARLQHRNLVRLLGFCLEGQERLLVYEFVANASLDRFLFDPAKRPYLDWERRYKIIGGVARGLLYLHEDSRLRIIHRDLKASNILLDDEIHPKIADFGMARLFIVDQTQGNTSRIVGTYGYMAPEYAMHGQFSVKSDVYSFGVLLLELVSGQKNNCFRVGETTEDLISFAWDSWRDGNAADMIDPAIINGPRNEIMRCIHIGLLCVQESVAARPTMASVVLMLSSFSLSLPLPSEPAFFVHSSVEAERPLLADYSSRTSISSHYKLQRKLVDGKEIGMNRLATNSGQGDLEFKNEIVIVAKLQQRNLVRHLVFVWIKWKGFSSLGLF
uniref:Protein kinase domain-containing protein n=1 Tax=Kalanchoe fedtschenkoi TaxID=63787 RepID=A0A7N1A7D1_KALFE